MELIASSSFVWKEYDEVALAASAMFAVGGVGGLCQREWVVRLPTLIGFVLGFSGSYAGR